MVEYGEAPLEREGRVKTLWGSLCSLILWKLLNSCGWIFGACLLLQLKSWNVRGVFHHPAVMHNCWTISHMFYSPIYPVADGNEGEGLVSEITSYFFLFGVNQVNCFGLKPRPRGEYLMYIVSVKITELRGRLKYQQGDASWVWYYFCTVAGSPLKTVICGLVVSEGGSNRRSPVQFTEWRNTNSKILLRS